MPGIRCSVTIARKAGVVRIMSASRSFEYASAAAAVG